MMPTQDPEEKLTAAARMALKDVLDEYRTQILVRAADSAASVSAEVLEISVHDIIRALRRTQERVSGRFPSPLERVLNLYSIAGLAMSVLALAYLAFRTFFARLDISYQLALLVSFAGFLIAATSFLTLRLREARIRVQEFATFPLDLTNLTVIFIARWQELELGLRKMAALILGESGAHRPLSMIVAELIRGGVYTSDDENTLLRLLQMRNRIVHQGVSEPKEELTKAVRDAERLFQKLPKVSA